MAIKAWLGGVPITVSSGQVWTLSYGVAPVERTFVTSRARARKILSRANPIEFRMEADGFPPLVVKNLYALQLVPVDENNMGVVVADVRWKFTRQSVTRDYNIRRRTGDYRRVGNELQEIQIKELIADVAFRRSTLRNGTRWTAPEILDDVLRALMGAGAFKIVDTRLAVDVEGLHLDRDRGDAALARALSYLPGAAVYVGLDGILNVVNQLDGSEAKAVREAGPRYRNRPGQLELVDRSRIRPADVIIQFEPEPEIRFNYSEDSPNPTLVAGKETRLLHNVIPVADPTLVINGKTYTEGSWVTIQDWITGVNAAAAGAAAGAAGGYPNGDASLALSMSLLRNHLLSGFQHLRNKLTTFQVGIPDVLWERRLAALAAHFRRTFRILPQWMDKLRSIKAVRASILDQEKGSRGKAEVYTDYFVKPSRRGLAKNAGHDRRLGYNVTGYAADLTDARSAPADITILDDEVGIFALNWRTDPWGDAAKMVPGTLSDLAVLGVALNDPLILDSEKVTLDSGWQLAVVLTVATAVPNNDDRLYAVHVPIDAAYAKIGANVVVPSKASGPNWTVGIGGGVDTARFMWSDTHASAIENVVFGLNSWENLKLKLLTNQATTDAVAVAMAARIHSLLLDRWEGSQIVALNPNMHPTGSMAQVTHGILGNGLAMTQMSLPPITQAPDIYALLPDSVRKILQRQVQQ